MPNPQLPLREQRVSVDAALPLVSAHLAHQGLLGRGRRPVSPANLRRHFLRWRIHNIWAEHGRHTQAPSSADLAQECAARGITGQYNRPIPPRYITDETPDFERRHHALTHP
ncbi:hypothetical protein [Streptomyces sp. NPDC002265]|uniref:hypothetical protein n=1 Tax=Streptomyces sp. NPDC002265 TaxID=3154415 RepID=UPI00332F09A4